MNKDERRMMEKMTEALVNMASLMQNIDARVNKLEQEGGAGEPKVSVEAPTAANQTSPPQETVVPQPAPTKRALTPYEQAQEVRKQIGYVRAIHGTMEIQGNSVICGCGKKLPLDDKAISWERHKEEELAKARAGKLEIPPPPPPKPAIVIRPRAYDPEEEKAAMAFGLRQGEKGTRKA